VRRIVYFGAHGIGGELVLVAAYALVGTLVALLLTRVRSAARAS